MMRKYDVVLITQLSGPPYPVYHSMRVKYLTKLWPPHLLPGAELLQHHTTFQGRLLVCLPFYQVLIKNGIFSNSPNRYIFYYLLLHIPGGGDSVLCWGAVHSARLLWLKLESFACSYSNPL